MRARCTGLSPSLVLPFQVDLRTHTEPPNQGFDPSATNQCPTELHVPRHFAQPLSSSLCFPLHSPLLRESRLLSIPPLIDMLKFSGWPHPTRSLGLFWLTSTVGRLHTHTKRSHTRYPRASMRVASTSTSRAHTPQGCSRLTI